MCGRGRGARADAGGGREEGWAEGGRDQEGKASCPPPPAFKEPGLCLSAPLSVCVLLPRSPAANAASAGAQTVGRSAARRRRGGRAWDAAGRGVARAVCGVPCAASFLRGWPASQPATQSATPAGQRVRSRQAVSTRAAAVARGQRTAGHGRRPLLLLALLVELIPPPSARAARAWELGIGRRASSSSG